MKKTVALVLSWLMIFSSIWTTITSASNDLSDLNYLLSVWSGPYSEIDNNINIWKQYWEDIKKFNLSFFYKLDNIVNKIVKRYSYSDISTILSDVLPKDSNYTVNEIKEMKGEVSWYQKAISNMANLLEKVKEIVKNKEWKKWSIRYKVFGYLYYKLKVQKDNYNKTVLDLQKKINELEKKQDNNIGDILSSILVHTGNNNVQTGNVNIHTGNNIIKKSVSFTTNTNIKIDTTEIELWRFNVKWWSYVDYYWVSKWFDEPINVLKCKLNNTNWNSLLKITWWYFKWLNYSGWPNIFERLNVSNIDNNNNYILSVKTWPITLVNNMKLVLFVNKIPSDKWTINCKFIYKKIWDNTNNLNLDKEININYYVKSNNNTVNNNVEISFENAYSQPTTIVGWTKKESQIGEFEIKPVGNWPVYIHKLSFVLSWNINDSFIDGIILNKVNGITSNNTFKTLWETTPINRHIDFYFNKPVKIENWKATYFTLNIKTYKFSNNLPKEVIWSIIFNTNKSELTDSNWNILKIKNITSPTVGKVKFVPVKLIVTTNTNNTSNNSLVAWENKLLNISTVAEGDDIDLKSLNISTNWLPLSNFVVNIDGKKYNDIRNINRSLSNNTMNNITIIATFNWKCGNSKSKNVIVKLNSITYKDNNTGKIYTKQIKNISNTLEYDGKCESNNIQTWNTNNTKVAYCISEIQPNGYIYSLNNKIQIVRYNYVNNKWKKNVLRILGSFKNNPNAYNVSYNFWHRVCHGGWFHHSCHYTWNPAKGYNIKKIYKWTKYEWLTDQNCFYASSSLDELKQKLSKLSIWKYPANFHWWNLNRNDNFWVVFTPKKWILKYLNFN